MRLLAQNLSGYKELLGITGHKPFECVGEIKECRYAFKQLIQKEEWKNDIKTDIEFPNGLRPGENSGYSTKYIKNQRENIKEK